MLCVSSPIGWDSEKKISIVVENMQLTSQLRADANIAFNDVIARQTSVSGGGVSGTPRKTGGGGGGSRSATGGAPELAIEDDQAFFLRQLTQMHKLQGGSGAPGGAPGAASAGGQGAMSASLAAKQVFPSLSSRVSPTL